MSVLILLEESSLHVFLRFLICFLHYASDLKNNEISGSLKHTCGFFLSLSGPLTSRMSETLNYESATSTSRDKRKNQGSPEGVAKRGKLRGSNLAGVPDILQKYNDIFVGNILSSFQKKVISSRDFYCSGNALHYFQYGEKYPPKTKLGDLGP